MQVSWKIKKNLIGILILVVISCATIPIKQQQKNIALIEASRKGDIHLVIELIQDGADINYQDSRGWNSYLAASSEGRFKVMKLLKSLGCQTDPGF